MSHTEIQEISIEDLKNKKIPALKLIDVRRLDEWQELHVKDAIHIPLDDIQQHISKYVASQKEPLYLYCRSGHRSQIAANTLMNMGYTQVYSIQGGIMHWANAFPEDISD